MIETKKQCSHHRGDVKKNKFNSKKILKNVYNTGCRFEIVNERYMTETCSCCGDRSGGPKGKSGLRIREWACAKCGT